MNGARTKAPRSTIEPLIRLQSRKDGPMPIRGNPFRSTVSQLKFDWVEFLPFNACQRVHGRSAGPLLRPWRRAAADDLPGERWMVCSSWVRLALQTDA